LCITALLSIQACLKQKRVLAGLLQKRLRQNAQKICTIKTEATPLNLALDDEKCRDALRVFCKETR
jgi:hypothetical protein